ncbi:hypothetical protein Cni_G09518 [Canna indica]|uniref:VHS domain-containing protein n=1 Tax=Canna indica TaxID=4628 RepID=A0AAQ3K2H3_9LILI|nr:hypothetical protein Cni_G09518 [Canna indica]
MDQSRRAVEAYWRSRMVDGVTSDEDKVAPVYKLEEICDLVRTSPAGIVKEVSDYILKRLDHKSPVVKQKALRLIKYAVGKSGNEFRREMQRHSAAMRQLFHYKGQLDPLKGDALNKAVRDTAHETITAIFASDDNKAVAPVESLNKRIQGFGNTNFEVPVEEKKSFLSEVVGLGSATIKQGLNTIAAAHSSMKNDTGSYKSPILGRSLAQEMDNHNEYQGIEHHQRGSWEASRMSGRNSGTWGPESRLSVSTSVSSEDTSSSNTGVKSREERLLETIATSGGVRLQPTRDALQAFLAEAAKLDGVAMSHAIEMKLQSHLWQVRMKAICVLESILRKKDDEHFISIVSYFTDNKESVVKCTELPQASLREKANKVLSLLDAEQTSGVREEPSNEKAVPAPVVPMPDLIDTSELHEYGSQNSVEKQGNQSTLKLKPSSQLTDDWLGNDPLADLSTVDDVNQDDPFADVSFHVTEDKGQGDLFSGLTVDDKKADIPESKKPDFLDVFGANSVQLKEDAENHKGNVHDLMDGLTINGNIQENKQPGAVGASGGTYAGLGFFPHGSQSSQIPTNGAMKGNLDLNSVYTPAPVQYGMSPNIMLNQGFVAQPINYNAMGALIAQQQLLLQNLGNLNPGFGHSAANAMKEGYSLPLPDVFQLTNNPMQNHASTMKSPKEDTKAFDFISVMVLSFKCLVTQLLMPKVV